MSVRRITACFVCDNNEPSTCAECGRDIHPAHQTFVFELPLPTNSPNRKAHWAKKRKARLAYWELLDTMVQAKKIPKAPKVALTKATGIVEMRTWRQMDKDNANGRLKDLNDWLQTRGYLVNDRDFDYTLTYRTAPRAELGITLVLREAA